MHTQATTAATSPQAPISLLHRITNDEEFRARLEADPVAAFAEVGVEIDPSMVPGTVRVPSPEILVEFHATSDTDPLADVGRGGSQMNWQGLLG